MRVLFDGWSLVHHPIHPASLHLISILENLPGEISPVLALPGPAPVWLNFPATKIVPTPNTPWGRLRWEQSRLPAISKALKSQVLHLFSPAAPIAGKMKTVFSPVDFGAGVTGWSEINHRSQATNHVLDRLRTSAGIGGLSRVSKIIWPQDLPGPALAGPIKYFPPMIPSQFMQHPETSHHRIRILTESSQDLHLPDDFILYHGPGSRHTLQVLLQAWNWAAAAIGEYHPLLLLGLDDQNLQGVLELKEQLGFGDSLQVLPGMTPDKLSGIYQQCTAVFLPAPASPWCGPIRLALASGKPLVAAENDFSAAVAGPAAYLVDGNDVRALGAALVSVVVEEELAGHLSNAAVRRTQNWQISHLGDQLFELYSNTARLD